MIAYQSHRTIIQKDHLGGFLHLRYNTMKNGNIIISNQIKITYCGVVFLSVFLTETDK